MFALLELIDTLWNVNAAISIIGTSRTIELIDTLWNVNVNHIMLYNICLNELIDTLWNVNKGECEIPLIYDRGINRYIMECKFFI